ncbi:hypothetical protein LX32DRAFT_93500 [Colletotrichum zoysiae]|uniref:Uncharacterized protein n=1 Tax=Colletotrichum zoysiae TaxID=1216348 RepID=A0AAD9HAX6_9PEZI|nr:hypothetical protein LX32DRAFT_93500 [Colletotrichum zoysiae]
MASSQKARYLVEGTPPPLALHEHGGGPDRNRPNRAEQEALADPDHPGTNILGRIGWRNGDAFSETRPDEEDIETELERVILLNEDFIAYNLELNSRCINIYQFQDPTGKASRAAGTERVNRAYFVGADALTGRPVVAGGIAKSNRGNAPNLGANFNGAAFVGHHTKTVATAPIPHTDLLRGHSQTLYIKRLTLGSHYPENGPSVSPTQAELDAFLAEERDRWEVGWPLRVNVLDPTAQPQLMNLEHTAPREWRYAHFYMMQVEGREIPHQLIRAIDRFRQSLPRDFLFSLFRTCYLLHATRFSLPHVREPRCSRCRQKQQLRSTKPSKITMRGSSMHVSMRRLPEFSSASMPRASRQKNSLPSPVTLAEN